MQETYLLVIIVVRRHLAQWRNVKRNGCLAPDSSFAGYTLTIRDWVDLCTCTETRRLSLADAREKTVLLESYHFQSISC